MSLARPAISSRAVALAGAPLTLVAHALDRIRAPTLAVLARSRWVRAAMRSRAARIDGLAALGLVGALVAALAAPALALLWTPLLLGVPHLLADVRYLALPGYTSVRWLRRDALVAVLVLATLAWPTPRLGGAAVLVAWWLAPLATPRTRAVSWRVLGGGVAIAGYALLWRAPIEASYVLVHAHNVVAVVLFACVFGRGRARWWIPLAVAAISAPLLSGALDPWLPQAALDDVAGYVLPHAALEHWPAGWCGRLAVLFVFLQGVHYAIWLRLIPEQARPREGMRSFRASLQALQRDVGPALLALVAALALLVLALGVLDASTTRQGYLRFAGFHAYLELAFLARWLAA